MEEGARRLQRLGVACLILAAAMAPPALSAAQEDGVPADPPAPATTPPDPVADPPAPTGAGSGGKPDKNPDGGKLDRR